MAADDFSRSLPRILVYEGGKVDDPRDPGGRTNQGVTQSTYNAFRRSLGFAPQDVYLMADNERDDIYRGMYWTRVDCDALPVGLDFVVFDAAVNSGCGQSGKWLQASLGDVYKGQIDGQIGAKTLQAIEDHGDVSGLIEEFCSRRLGTLKRLRTWSIYGVGWHARIANGEKIALSWQDGASSFGLVHPVDVSAAGGHRKAIVNDNIKPPVVSQIAAHVTTAATSTATIASQSAQQIQPLADTFGWIKYVFGGLTVAAVVAGIAVKVASDANTAALDGVAKASVNPDADANFVPVKVVDGPVTQKAA